MSKAFGTVDRKKLMNILGSILTKYELHMMHALTNDMILDVKIENKTVPDIHTNIAICQGDCLSALLFILYLAFAVNPLQPVTSAIDYHKPLWSAFDCTITLIEMYTRSLSTQSVLMIFHSWDHTSQKSIKLKER